MKKKHKSCIVNVMNFCWCADLSHMLSIHLHEQCKYILTSPTLTLEGIFPCYGTSLSTTVKRLHSHGQSLHHVHGRCISLVTGTV